MKAQAFSGFPGLVRGQGSWTELSAPRLPRERRGAPAQIRIATMAEFQKSGSKEAFYGIARPPPRKETAKRFFSRPYYNPTKGKMQRERRRVPDNLRCWRPGCRPFYRVLKKAGKYTEQKESAERNDESAVQTEGTLSAVQTEAIKKCLEWKIRVLSPRLSAVPVRKEAGRKAHTKT